MTKAQLLKQTRSFAQEKLADETSGHDWWHIERVLGTAKVICAAEGADPFIVQLAIMLHDIGDRKVLGTKEDDYSIAENYLVKNAVSPVVVEHVMFIIKNMSFRYSNRSKRDGASREFYVVQDADRLDAMGAVGIARVFAFGGKKGRPVHIPKGSKKLTLSNYASFEDASIRHFYEKLLILKSLLNTKAAHKIAVKRQTHMENYLTQFFAEWNGLA